MTIIETAEKELGVTDQINGKVNPEVLKWLQKIGATYEPGYEFLACAAFIGFILETCGIRSTRALNARSYLGWGFATDKPVQGDVVVFWRDSIQSANGHVSFYHHEDENTVYCLGGNQAGGVVSIEGYPKSRVLGYRSAINRNAPQAQTTTHMEPENTAGVELIQTGSATMPAAVKFVNFFGEDGSRATVFMETKTMQNDGETHDFHSVQDALARNTSESFVFWNGSPIGVGQVKE